MKKFLSLILLFMILMTSLPVMAENNPSLEPYEEAVTMNIMAKKVPGTWFPEGEDFTDNVLIDYYLERLNIDIESIWTTDSGNYSAQIDLMIAADNLPDVFYATPQQLYRMVQANQIQPIGEVYEQYASDDVKAVLGDSTSQYFSQGTVNGQVYGFPSTEDRCLYMPQIWVRQDWLNKVGMEAPSTWAEYEKVMRAFMDQCGAKYGVAFDASNVTGKCGWTAFMNPFKAYYGSWVNKDGAITYSGITEETKAALAKMNEWYEAGYLSPEFAMSNFSIMNSDICQNNVGMFIHIFYPTGFFQELFYADPSIEWVACPIPACEDGSYAVEANVKATAYVVVNAKYEHPEALIKYMNLWHDMWRGESGEYYHGLNNSEYLQADEYFKLYVPFWFDPPTKNMRHSEICWEIWPDGDITTYEKDYELVKQWNNMHDFRNGNTANLSGYGHIICYMNAFYMDAKLYDCNNSAVVDAFTGPLSEDYSIYKAATDSTMEEYFVAAIMGAKNLESDWDSYVESWQYAGGDFMTQYVNEWYVAQ